MCVYLLEEWSGMNNSWALIISPVKNPHDMTVVQQDRGKPATVIRRGRIRDE